MRNWLKIQTLPHPRNRRICCLGATFRRASKLAADMLVSHLIFGLDGWFDDTKLMSSARAI
jgi:hypothetical protein